MVDRLGINHQSPLIHFDLTDVEGDDAGNQSPIPFDTLLIVYVPEGGCWESITNPL